MSPAPAAAVRRFADVYAQGAGDKPLPGSSSSRTGGGRPSCSITERYSCVFAVSNDYVCFELVLVCL